MTQLEEWQLKGIAQETIFVNYLGYGCFDEPCIERMSASQIEYVRKDFFVEKACKWLEKNFNMPNDFECHFHKAMEEE